MKIKLLSAIVLLSSLAMAQVNYLSKEKIVELSKSSKFLSNSYTRIIEGIDEKDTYFLELQYKGKSVNCFVDKHTGAIYKGERYDSNGTLSTFTKSPKRIAKIQQSLNNAISFSYGTGKKELYLFTDPECPYCKKFERQAKGLLGDYTVHVILYPLRFHKHAPAMTEWIMRGKDDAQKHARAEEVMIKNSQTFKSLMPKDKKLFKYSPSVQQWLQKSISTVRSMHITGTPTILDTSFNKVNWGKLLEAERQKNKQTKK